MEKIPLNPIWKRRLQDIYEGLPESEEPDLDIVDQSLSGVFEMLIILSEELDHAVKTIENLENQVESLSLFKDIKAVLDEVKSKKNTSESMVI